MWEGHSQGTTKGHLKMIILADVKKTGGHSGGICVCVCCWGVCGWRVSVIETGEEKWCSCSADIKYLHLGNLKFGVKVM